MLMPLGVVERRLDQGVPLGGDRERVQDVEAADLAGRVTCVGVAGLQGLDEVAEQRSFARQRLGLAGERVVLEPLEFRHDVALGVLEGLAPDVVGGHGVGGRARGLDVVAVHPVVADLQSRDTRALPFAHLERRQPIGSVLGQVLQPVEFRVVAAPDHAAFPRRRGRVVHQGALEESPFLVEGR